ncbi:MAG: ABC transporter permease subunit [Firmicutes bacterium]|nr:ABC transporter permease subunit [Bacillota bacterium]
MKIGQRSRYLIYGTASIGALAWIGMAGLLAADGVRCFLRNFSVALMRRVELLSAHSVEITLAALVISGGWAFSAAGWRLQQEKPSRMAKWLDTAVDAGRYAPSVVIGLIIFQWTTIAAQSHLSVYTGISALVLINTPFLAHRYHRIIQKEVSRWQLAAYALGASSAQLVRYVAKTQALPDLLRATGSAWAKLLAETAAMIYVLGWHPPHSLQILSVAIWQTSTHRPEPGSRPALIGLVLVVMIVAVIGLTEYGARQIENRRR